VSLLDTIKAEPVLAQGVVVAAVAMGSAFGLGFTGEQVGAVTSFTASVLMLITRRYVSPLGGTPLPPPAGPPVAPITSQED
jgi:hypothetical protein